MGEAFPDPCSRFQPEGPHGPSQVVSPRRYQWKDGAWGDGRSRARSSTSCTSAPSRPRAPTPRRPRKLPLLKDLGITMLELMPLARLPGPLQLGLRRRAALRARTPPTGGRTSCARLVDEAHAPGPRRHPRRRLQPPRPGRELPGAVLPGLLHDKISERVGRRASTSMGERRGPVARLLHRRTPATGWTSSTSTACALDATQSLYDRSDAAHRRGASPSAVRAGGGRRDVIIVGENEPQDVRAGAARRPRAATAWTRCGSTTSTTRRGSPRGAPRRTCRTIGARAQELLSCVHAQLALPGAVLRLAEAAPRHARAAAWRPSTSSSSCRTTIRSPTRSGASGCTLCGRRRGPAR